MKTVYLFIIFFLLSSCVTQQKNVQKSEDHHKIAVSLLKECDKPRALSHLLKAKRLNSRNPSIRYTLAVVYYSMGLYDKALLEFKRVLKIKSDFTEARVSLSRLYIDLNQINKSLKELKMAEKDITYPDPLKIISQKGLIYYKKRKYQTSKRWLEEALSLPKGKSCFVYLYLGKTELALKNFKKSEKFLKKALALCSKEKQVCSQPDYQEHLALAELYILKKDNKRAKYHLNLFLKKVKQESKTKKAKELLKKISRK